VDYVKLDGAYTRGLLVNARDASILRTMVDLCASLRVRTIAEMIETEDQAGALAGLGIELGQGWLLGRPRASPVMAPQPGPQPRMARRQGAREQWC
jgi:EAL domain-containing protein (putative c-di-GMP-specific phosphodiesterase class I)